jgi:hypothetical protein
MAAIRELTEAWDAERGLGHVLGLEEALARPWSTEEPRTVGLEELAERFPSDDPLGNLQRAIDIGLIDPEPDGASFTAPSPTFLEAGAELVASGLPVTAVLDIAQEIRHSTDHLADTFVRAFLDYIWAPFEAAGEPADRLADIVASVDRQRPWATAAVAAVLAQALQKRVDEAIMASPSDTRRQAAGQ